MERKRALLAATVSVVVIVTGTVAAAAQLGLIGTNDKPVPVGDLDLATVTSNANAEATSPRAPIRVELVDGVVHIYQPDGSEVTVPLPAEGSESTATPVDQPQGGASGPFPASTPGIEPPVVTGHAGDALSAHDDD